MEASLAGLLEEGKGFEEWEDRVFGWACQWGRELIGEAMEALDLALSQGRGPGLRFVGKRPRTLITRLGDITFERRLYREKDTGRYRFLLDEVLGLPVKEAVSKVVADLALGVAAVLPFRRAVAILEKFLPQGFSATALQRLVWRFGKRVEEAEGKSQEATFGDGEVPPMGKEPASRLFVEGDGVSVALQREKERRGEVKTGIGYTGWERLGADRYGTVGKVVHAGMEETDTFWERFWLKACQRYDLSRLEEVVLGGDGAGWIAEGLMGLPGRFQLDRFHLWRAIRRALAGQEALAGQVYHEATQGTWEKVDELLAGVLSSPDLLPEREKGVREVRQYMLANREGLRDWRSGAKCQPGDRALGAMEGNVDKLVAIRTKRRGMSWRKTGLHSMAKLLQSVYQGEVGFYASPCRQRPLPALKATPRRSRLKVRAKGQDTPFKATLPVVRGPHASRPWARLIKAICAPSLNP